MHSASGNLTLITVTALLLLAFEPAHAQTETVLYSFCPGGYPCSDGAVPAAGLIMDKKGNLYGTTLEGGLLNGNCEGSCGTVFKISSTGEESLLYNFCSEPNCEDGDNPYATLVMDKEGNLYGTASAGGLKGCSYGCGTVFRITPNGQETVRYSFCSDPSCADGETPGVGLIIDKKGNLYGTTANGGANSNGTVFKVTP
jgi:uncharacterized repeat protein (TIGR03803 family)